MLLACLLLVAPLLAASVPVNEPHDHSHAVPGQLSGQWYHRDDHPVHALFRRGPTDGTNYVPVGNAEWSAGFPPDLPDPDSLPKAWVDALNNAVQAKKIPDIPQSTNPQQTNPKYPNGFDPNGQVVCSSTYQCRNPEDHWDVPEGFFASSFDDGPHPMTDPLVGYLQSNNAKTTHFMIGQNILLYWRHFLTAFQAGHDIAVHTWSHRYMTTLSNLEVVGELGWTMELIRNSTGGRVPRYWRPPYGDADNRVRAIAKEVFGLETVIWNQDTSDWSLNTGGTTPEKVHDDMVKWLTGPKSPGLMVLEHEITNASVGAFIDAFPMIRTNGWKFESLARVLNDGQVYQNSKDTDSAVIMDDIMNGIHGTTSSSSSLSQSSTSSQSPTSEPSGTPTAGNLAASTPSTTNAALSNWDKTSYLWIITTVVGASTMTAATLWV